MECPNCAFQNTPGLRTCVRCQSRLDLADVAIEPPRRGRAGVSSRTRYRMHTLAHRTRDDLTQRADSLRSALLLDVRWSTLLWSVIPGLGHIHAGLRRTGQSILVCWLGLLVLALLFIGGGLGWLLGAAALGFHCFIISLLMARALAQVPIYRRLIVGVGVYLVLLFGLYVPALYVGRGFARVINTNNFHDTPAVQRGRAALLGPMEPATNVAAHGDLVVYRIHGLGVGNIAIAGGSGLDRIIGVAGDHVVFDGKILTVNGEPAPASQHPLRGLRRLPPLDVEVTDGCVFVLPSALRWRLNGAAAERQMGPLIRSISMVPAHDLQGIVWWRLRPWWRFGAARAPDPTEGASPDR